MTEYNSLGISYAAVRCVDSAGTIPTYIILYR